MRVEAVMELMFLSSSSWNLEDFTRFYVPVRPNYQQLPTTFVTYCVTTASTYRLLKFFLCKKSHSGRIKMALTNKLSY